MANADFSQKQNSTSGGFDAGSYREQKQPEQAVPLTPLQQKLAGLEAKLPAALSTRAAALALSVVVMLAAFLGFGSAKLRSRYNEVRKWYTVGVAADNGYNLNEELTTRINTAAKVRHSPRCPIIRAARCMRCIRPTRCWGRGSISSTQSCRSRPQTP